MILDSGLLFGGHPVNSLRVNVIFLISSL